MPGGHTEIRYRPGSDNRILLSALWRAHNMRCYWCAEPKEFRGLQIDHILPKTANERQLHRLAVELDLSQPYDVHDPYNLAPICSPCNSAKRDADFTRTPRVLSELRKARRVRPDVINHVELLTHSGDLTELLLQFQNLDLHSRAARSDFERLAPFFVGRIAALDPVLVQHRLRRSIRLHELGRRGDPIVVEFDVADADRRDLEVLARLGSAPEMLLELVWSEYGRDFRTLIATGLDQTAYAADHQVEKLGRVGVPSHYLDCDELTVSITEARFDAGEEVVLDLAGEAQFRITGSCVIATDDGSGLNEFGVESFTTVPFTATFHADELLDAAWSASSTDLAAGSVTVDLYEPILSPAWGFDPDGD